MVWRISCLRILLEHVLCLVCMVKTLIFNLLYIVCTKKSAIVKLKMLTIWCVCVSVVLLQSLVSFCKYSIIHYFISGGESLHVIIAALCQHSSAVFDTFRIYSLFVEFIVNCQTCIKLDYFSYFHGCSCDYYCDGVDNITERQCIPLFLQPVCPVGGTTGKTRGSFYGCMSANLMAIRRLHFWYFLHANGSCGLKKGTQSLD